MKKQRDAIWQLAADFKGDFQNMSVRAFSEMTYFSALAMRRLGREKEAETLLQNLLSFANEMASAPAKIDYFATSLPTLLLFDDDIQYRRETTAMFLAGQAHLGLGDIPQGTPIISRSEQARPEPHFGGGILERMPPAPNMLNAGRSATTDFQFQ